MKIDEKQLKTAVWEAMKEILAEQKPMPVPAPSASVTEIIIRTGTSEAMKVFCPPPPPPLEPKRAARGFCPPPPPPLKSESGEQLQRIKDKTGEEPEDVIRKLELRLRDRQLEAEILEYAKEVGVE